MKGGFRGVVAIEVLTGLGGKDIWFDRFPSVI